MRVSVGLVLFRRTDSGVVVLVGHMGGPYFANKHHGGWTFPKGLAETDETPEATAEREFAEELGHPPPPGPTIDLGAVTTSGKSIRLFAREGDFDAATIMSNRFELEWPPGSGRRQSFPELDRAAWVNLDQAETMLAKNQRAFVARVRELVS